MIEKEVRFMKDDTFVRKAPLPWLLAGLCLGLVQILAIWAQKPLGISTQFVIVESVGLHKVVPEYAAEHPLISAEKYRPEGDFEPDVRVTFQLGGESAEIWVFDLEDVPNAVRALTTIREMTERALEAIPDCVAWCEEQNRRAGAKKP